MKKGVRSRFRRRPSFVRGAGLALFLLLLGLGVGACQEEAPAAAVPGSGYEVLPRFETFYGAFGGSALLGEAITSACEAPDGRIVQYFQRARLDSLPAQDEVMVYPLGTWALSGIQTPVPAPVPGDSEERFFPETGYAVQDEFLTFYEANQGEIILGPPLSTQLNEGELRVQYFRNGRLEWHPEAPRSLRVRLGPLGQAHYLQEGNRALRCDVLARPAAASQDLAVEVEAAVKAPILYTDEEQEIYVEVTTPAGQPVSGMPVFLSVTYRGETFDRVLGETGDGGQVAGSLSLPVFVPGEEVEVKVFAYGADNEILGNSALSFKTWW